MTDESPPSSPSSGKDPNSPSSGKDEALERLWAEMALVHEVDFKAIARRVFGATNPASMTFSKPLYESTDDISRDNTILSFGKFYERHARVRKEFRELVMVFLPWSITIVGGFLILGMSTSADEIGPISSEHNMAIFLLLTVVCVTASFGIIWLISVNHKLINHKLINHKLINHKLRRRVFAFDIVGRGVVAASVALGVLFSLGWYISTRNADDAADAKAAKTELRKIVIEAMRQRFSATCSRFSQGAVAGEFIVKSNYCDRAEAKYVIKIGNIDWAMAIVKPAEATITSLNPRYLSYLGEPARASWIVRMGEAVTVHRDFVALRDRDGRTRNYVPEKNAALPKEGSDVAVETPEMGDRRASFWELATADDILQ